MEKAIEYLLQNNEFNGGNAKRGKLKGEDEQIYQPPMEVNESQKSASENDQNVMLDRGNSMKTDTGSKIKFSTPETATSRYSKKESKLPTYNTNSATTEEAGKLRELDDNSPNTDILKNDLIEKGLNPQHWYTIFQEQGLQSKKQFQHIDQLTLDKLLSHTKYTWERGLLYKLVEDNNKDDISRQEAMFEKLRSKLPDLQKNITDAFKMNDDRSKRYFDDNTWVKAFDLDTKVKDRLNLETNGQQLVTREPLGSFKLINQIAGGQLLRGQFISKNFGTSSTYRRKLIEVDEQPQLMSPGISETMETFEFTNKTQSDKFDSVLTQTGISGAVAVSKGISSFAGFQVHAAGEQTNYEKNETTINEQKYFVKINKILSVPMASFTLSNQKVTLSVSAWTALKRLHVAFGKNEGDFFKKECKVFFHEFGSHYYTGLCHFGGRYVWTVTSFSKANTNRNQNLEMARSALSGSLAVGLQWVGFEIKGSYEKKSENGKSNQNSSEKCEISKKLEKFGGPQEVDDISIWKKGLAQYNNTWMIIDKDLSQKCYEGVWKLIQDQKVFGDAKAFGEAILSAWKEFQEDKPSDISWITQQFSLDDNLANPKDISQKPNTIPSLDKMEQKRMDTLHDFKDIPSVEEENSRSNTISSGSFTNTSKPP